MAGEVAFPGHYPKETTMIQYQIQVKATGKVIGRSYERFRARWLLNDLAWNRGYQPGELTIVQVTI
jgi:hypothetical protein